jgi:hypothetical protein
MNDRDLNDERINSAGLPHAAAREQLPAHAAALARGHALAPDAELSTHLAACAACRAELDELAAVAMSAYDGQIPAAPAYPAADLSFLTPADALVATPALPTHAHPWQIDKRGRLAIQFSPALVAGLAPRAAVGAARGQFLFRYVQEPGSVDDLGVTIEVFAEDAARNLGRVRVGVDVPSRDALDQSGSRVVVRAGEAAWQGETDESGSVDLAPIPLNVVNQMRVEITPMREC